MVLLKRHCPLFGHKGAALQNSNFLHIPDNMPQYKLHMLDSAEWRIPVRYDNLVKIGQGAFANVCSSHDSQSNCEVAIKKLIRPFHNKGHAKRLYRELSILYHMKHENVLSMIDVFTPQNCADELSDIYIVTPLMAWNLDQVIQDQRLGPERVQYVLYQILRALKYIHSAGIIHRDLKPANIGINEDCDIKILDFGLARSSDEGMTAYVVTRSYRAPELLHKWTNSVYTEKVDMWSVGCILVEMFTQKKLFICEDCVTMLEKMMMVTGTPDEDFMLKIENEDIRCSIHDRFGIRPRPSFPEYFRDLVPDSDAIDLLDRILVLDSDRRIGAVDALQHRYFRGIHDEDNEPTREVFQDGITDHDRIEVEQWRAIIWQMVANLSASGPAP